MPDLRLALPAVALWIACAVLIGMPAPAGVVAVVAGAMAAGMASVAAGAARVEHARGRASATRLRFLPLVATLLGATALGSAVVAIDAPGRVSAALDQAARETDQVEVLIRVERTPNRMATAGFGGEARWTMRGRTVGGEAEIPVSLQFGADVATARTFAVGTVVRTTGQALVEEAGEATSYTIRTSGEDEPSIVQPPPPWLAWAAAARTVFALAAGETPGDGGALLPGLAIGDET